MIIITILITPLEINPLPNLGKISEATRDTLIVLA